MYIFLLNLEEIFQKVPVVFQKVCHVGEEATLWQYFCGLSVFVAQERSCRSLNVVVFPKATITSQEQRIGSNSTGCDSSFSFNLCIKSQ